MTEYDYSPEAYDRYIQTQTRVANWVHHTEQHRQGFESAAPGAPGIPPVLRQPSPPIQERYMHKLSPSYPIAPIYNRALPSSLSSEDSYVHVPPPQTRRLRPPPPPIYAPPVPPPAPFPVHSHPSPVIVRVEGDRLSPSSSRRYHHRSKSHSHDHRSPPPLMTPIYTSPAASPFIPPPPIIYLSSQGHPSPNVARPIVSPREIYRKPSSPRKARRARTPPVTPISPSSLSTDDTPTSPCQTSSPNSPTSVPFPPSPAPASGPSKSGPGGSRFHAFSVPWLEDPNQKYGQYQNQHHRHTSPSILPGLDPPYISRNLLEQLSNSSQRLDYHHRSYHHPCHDQSRRSSSQSYSHPHSQSHPSPVTLRAQPYARHSDPLYDRHGSKLSTATATTTPHNGVISISVPPLFPTDDRESSINSNSSRSHAHTKQIAPPVLHAPKPMRHPGMLGPQLRASARA